MVQESPWLEFCNVEAWSKDHKIFSSLNLKLYLNEQTVILGPNGSGKSSLIKLINRSLYPIVKENSSLKLFNSETINIMDIRSRVGFVSAEIEERIKPGTKAWEVIYSGYLGSIGLGICNIVDKDLKENTLKLMNFLNLESIKDMNFEYLSEGQKRYVIIARSLINNPEILIFDEPTIKLDIKAKYQLLNILNKLSEAGKTIVQVTHQIDTITKGSTRIIFLKKGCIIDDGPVNVMLTSEKLSKLYDLPLKLINSNTCWQIINV